MDAADLPDSEAHDYAANRKAFGSGAATATQLPGTTSGIARRLLHRTTQKLCPIPGRCRHREHQMIAYRRNGPGRRGIAQEGGVGVCREARTVPSKSRTLGSGRRPCAAGRSADVAIPPERTGKNSHPPGPPGSTVAVASRTLHLSRGVAVHDLCLPSPSVSRFRRCQTLASSCRQRGLRWPSKSRNTASTVVTWPRNRALHPRRGSPQPGHLLRFARRFARDASRPRRSTRRLASRRLLDRVSAAAIWPFGSSA